MTTPVPFSGDIDAFGQKPFTPASPKFQDANPFDAALAQTQQNGELLTAEPLSGLFSIAAASLQF